MSMEPDTPGAAELPPWADCDFFCIHDYAGTGAAHCGWRGRLQQARQDPGDTRLLCPRCGCASLLRIPVDGADPSEG